MLLLAAAVLPGDDVLRTVALAAGGIALFEAAAVAFDANTESAVLLGQGVVLLTVAAVLRSRRVLLVGAGFAVLGVLTVLGEQVPLSALVDFPAAPFVLGIAPSAKRCSPRWCSRRWSSRPRLPRSSRRPGSVCSARDQPGCGHRSGSSACTVPPAS